MAGAFRAVAEWKQILLAPPRQIAFAEQAMGLKPNAAIEPASLLNARRQEDAARPGDPSRSLWAVLNVIEENIMLGGISGRNRRGRLIRTRPVRGIVADIAINRGLWRIAEAAAKEG